MKFNRLLLLLLLLLFGVSAAAQPTFNGYNVTNYDLVKNDDFTKYKEGLYVSRENTGDFDAILIYPQRKRFVFADQNKEDSTFKSTYAELVDRYGQEDENRDSIPSSYEGEKLDHLHRLVRGKQARIHRQWEVSEQGVRQVILIWDHGGLTLVFDGTAE